MEFIINTKKRTEFVDITDIVKKKVKEVQIEDGICFIYVPHTTAGITINENYDPSVKEDIESTLSRLVPKDGGYTHLEGNADAHIKASIIGTSVSLIIENGDLLLGRWQGIFFCEFDGPRRRKIFIKIIKT